MTRVSPADTTETAINLATMRLEAWLDTMRGSDGYGGPVVHWWRHCLHFTGAGLDWRYEGIITGYLHLYEATGGQHWLVKARRAGDDLLRGLLPSGSYRNSSFELNPNPEGTPHEAACDIALLRLASALRQHAPAEEWQPYLRAARDNLREFYIRLLWRPGRRYFSDSTVGDSFVPNKVATLVEALYLLADLSGDDNLMEHYVLPTVNAILDHQVHRPGSPLDGAIFQNRLRNRRVGKFFPFYTARCVPALVLAYETTGSGQYLDAARRALAFVWRWRSPDGGFPQVVYADGHCATYPRWVAGVADILRATSMLKTYGFTVDDGLTLDWLLSRQLPNGAFPTAEGFAVQLTKRAPSPPPHFYDLLPVVGWNDKTFRYLTSLVSTKESRLHAIDNIPAVELECRIGKRLGTYREDASEITLHVNRRQVYRWVKGQPWADIQSPALWSW
jgi:hypothetical protein